MAAYLALYHTATGETFTGGKLVEVDNMMRLALGAEPDPVNWHLGWMNWAGFSIAVRYDKSITDALSHHMEPGQFGEPDPESVKVCEWLIANFENRSF